MINLRNWMSPVRVGWVYVGVLALLSLSTVGSAVALWHVAGEEPRTVLVDGADGPRVVEIGRIPDALARDFAVDFVVSFETYSPGTVEKVAAFCRSRVAPPVRPDFSRLLEGRMELVRESSMVSQLLVGERESIGVIRSESSRAIEVELRAERRIYIAGRQTERAHLWYRLGIESGQPTRENPTGLLVTGQSVRVAGEGDSP